MGKTIIANVMPEETRMAILEEGDLAEVVVERSESGHIVGNLYKGKVTNVLPGMQAAFIDIGRDKNAFLYVGDTFPQIDVRQPEMQTTLSVGQDIMIQIIKDALGTKGPRATTQLTLPGRYVVLMPTVDYIGISRRIAKEGERERLRALAENVRPAGMGIIVRTVAEGKSEEDLAADIEYLHNLWHSITARAKRAHAPSLLYRDVDLIIRIVRDYLSFDVDTFILDNREAYARVCDLLTVISPEMVDRVVHYQGTEEIFSYYGIAGHIENINNRRVALKCGGYLVIDRTEALTVIDVNTGKFVGQTNLAETVFQANLEAAAEIARQLRLRDIGGIIIIDFIDMERSEHQEALLKVLEDQLKRDRTKSNVLGLTHLGLVEMTRKKARQNLETMLYSDCPCCEGRGRIKSPETIAINIKRELRRINQQRRAGKLVIQAHPRVAEVLTKQELSFLEQQLGRRLSVAPVASMNPEVFTILLDPE